MRHARSQRPPVQSQPSERHAAQSAWAAQPLAPRSPEEAPVDGVLDPSVDDDAPQAARKRQRSMVDRMDVS